MMLRKLLKRIAETWSKVYPTNESTTDKIREIAKRMEAKTGENALADLAEGTFDEGSIILAICRLRDAYDYMNEPDPSLETMIRQLEIHFADELGNFDS